MIIDGRQMAREVLQDVSDRMKAIGVRPRMLAITCMPSPETRAYLKTKSSWARKGGVDMDIIELPSSTTTEECIQIVRTQNSDACIVQMPLPPHIDSRAVLETIPFEKDADVLSSFAYGKFEKGDVDALLPPVAAAVALILSSNSIQIQGKNVVVVGAGSLVGKPCAHFLREQGAIVTVVTKESNNLKEALKEADIVVSGAGVPNLITPELLKEGVVLIDAGTSESAGTIVGDADSSCAGVASLFTPVPGGVGPISVACLFGNVATLVERSRT